MHSESAVEAQRPSAGDMTVDVVARGPIKLQPMRQQAMLLAPNEDWTGISCPVERRRLQNRLNQRARRLRQGSKPRKGAKQIASSGQTVTTAHVADAMLAVLPKNLHEVCGFRADQMNALFASLETWAARSMARELLVGPSPFADRLLVVSRFNVFRAMMQNFLLLDVTYEAAADDDALSAFSSSRSGTTSSTPSSGDEDGSVETATTNTPDEEEGEYAHLPPSMRPTRLQRTVPHHPWIDTLPVPRMRDNILSAGARFEAVEEQFCVELADFSSDSTGCTSPPSNTSPSTRMGGGGRDGILIWGESWDPRGWELTEAFVLRWGWVLRGCTEIFESTNYWRAKRGEKPFPFQTS